MNGREPQGGVCVAIVSRQEVVDSRKIGTIVAAEIGFTADVFTKEEDALNWLGGIK